MPPWHFLNFFPLPHGHGSFRPACTVDIFGFTASNTKDRSHIDGPKVRFDRSPCRFAPNECRFAIVRKGSTGAESWPGVPKQRLFRHSRRARA